VRILRMDAWAGQPGGGQEYVHTVSDELRARGHDNLIFTLTDRPPPHPRTDERAYVVPTSQVRRLPRDVVGDPAFERGVREAVDSFRPDILHIHRFDSAFHSIARLTDRLGLPVVFTAHDAKLVCPISTLVLPSGEICEGGILPRCAFTGCRVGSGVPYSLYQRREFDARVRPSTRAFLSPSHRLVEYLTAHGYRPAVHLPSFAVIPPDVRRMPYDPKPAGAPPVVGFLGRVEPYKGVSDLVEAVAILATKLPKLRLDVAGEGSSIPSIRKLVAARGLEGRTTLRGHVGGTTKEEWFRYIDVLAVPSVAWENFGLVALEALVRGRPVVAPEFGGLPDIVADGETGRLVPLANPPALAAAVEELLSDRTRSSRLALEGRRRVLERYTPELHVDRLLAVYREILDGRPIPDGTDAATLVAS
jgi:glycosyltransferase involved in cell wall biosynthesis